MGLLVEKRLGRAACLHRLGHSVGLPLVGIARRADTALELDTAPLLHDMGCLVGGELEVGGLLEGDAVAPRVGARAKLLARLACRPAHLHAHICKAVTTERVLDGSESGQRLGGSS